MHASMHTAIQGDACWVQETKHCPLAAVVLVHTHAQEMVLTSMRASLAHGPASMRTQ
jgi:hypothetical protein